MTGTAFPGWYVTLQTALLQQAPRPGEITQEVAEAWADNQSALKKTLAAALVPPATAHVPARTRIRAPKGARIRILRGVKTLLDGEWQAAINVGAPDTPASYNIRKVGNLYLPTGAGLVEEDMILLNYPEGGGSMEKALAWARAKSLTPDDPRRILAAGNQYPELPRILGCDPMYLVAPVECTFEGRRHAACVWCNGSERKAGLDWVSYVSNSSDWFAFRK